jgi:AhpD family alkylhydroperoxidase
MIKSVVSAIKNGFKPMNQFHKKIYTFRQYRQDIGFILKNIPRFINAIRNKDIPRSFAEKIMLVITAVNGCCYCSWFHAKQAMTSGINEDEVKEILNLQFHTRASHQELPALLFAQHYAETDRNPDKEVLDKLIDFYGEKTATDIILYIRLIYFGNLTGNTFDAFLSRLRGIKAQNSSLLFELFFFVLNCPILLPLSLIIKRELP